MTYSLATRLEPDGAPPVLDESLPGKTRPWWQLSTATPYLAMNLAQVRRSYNEFLSCFPTASIYYAVKANPATSIVETLNHLGASFDVASANELLLCLNQGVPASRISFGNTAKRATDIRLAFELGVRHFTADSIGELEKIAANAPGAHLTIRLLINAEGADWPLSRKFGCDSAMARRLLHKAAALQLNPFGISFHVGSQQGNPTAWDAPIRLAAEIFRDLAAEGIYLEMLNLGGGFPARYTKQVPHLAAYGEAIRHSLERHFSASEMPKIMLEPGRGLVGDAGVLVSEILLVSTKSDNDPRRWVFLDCGRFGGLIETLDEAIRYRIETDHDGEASSPAIIAGPTCDSQDIVYEKNAYPLPDSLRSGDRVRVLSAGAYTYTCALSGFNGFDPLTCVCL